jgi:hypothetical protein
LQSTAIEDVALKASTIEDDTGRVQARTSRAGSGSAHALERLSFAHSVIAPERNTFRGLI